MEFEISNFINLLINSLIKNIFKGMKITFSIIILIKVKIYSMWETKDNIINNYFNKN